MRRTLSTALLLGLALPAFALSAAARQSDAKPDAAHVTPQSPEAAPHGTAPSAPAVKQTTTHHKKKKKKPAATAANPHVTPQTPETPHVTPQTPEASHVTPQ